MDENMAPVNSSRGVKTRSATRREQAAKLQDIKSRTKPFGTKRAVLGDVTNKQGSLTDKDSTKGLKKRPSVTTTKPRSAKRHEIPTEITSSGNDTPTTEPQGSPMCISNDLESMTLDRPKYDIDSVDKADELSAWEYAEDIYKYYLDLENERCVDPLYMSKQEDINSKMRAILLDWLVDVHAKYGLLPQTLHITVNLIDRYLQDVSFLDRCRLQLVGVTCMFIASKFEEIYPPEAYDFVRITDNAYTIDEVFDREEEILETLRYRVLTPTAYGFLVRYLKASGSDDEKLSCYANYIIDRSLQEYKLLKYKPSVIAASSVCIARSVFGQAPWNATVEYHSTYSKEDLKECMDDLREMLWNTKHGIGKQATKLTAAKRKYSKSKYHCVAEFVEVDQTE